MTSTVTVPGLTTTQRAHAAGILAAVRGRGLPRTAAVIAIETALAESGLTMYANANNPESLQLPHDAVGSDHGSVGLFQQQVGGAANSTADWGTTRQLMDATVSTRKFLKALELTNWRHVNRWVAAQNVQHSAYDGSPRQANNFSSEYGGNYHGHDTHAREIVDALWQGDEPAPPRLKYFVDLFADAGVFPTPTSTQRTGTLHRGRNYVYGKRPGRTVSTEQGRNHWWLLTDPDEGSGVWVSAYYLTHWGDDEARDNDGIVIPDC